MSKSTTETVTMRRQYLQIKARYPDTILLFRIGDFYEALDDDATRCGEALDVPVGLLRWDGRAETKAVGIPYHAADGYIARLIAAGHKVAICEQTGPPLRDTTPRQEVMPLEIPA